MVEDRQVKRLWQSLSSGKSLAQSADKANMDEKTARRYKDLGRLPSEVAPERTWRTREDPFAEVWPEVHELLQEAHGLEAKSLFVSLQTKYPGKFDDSQLRSFQRGVKRWQATAGPAKEVFFSQVHHPGRLCASDFTHMKSLAVTIGGQPFDQPASEPRSPGGSSWSLGPQRLHLHRFLIADSLRPCSAERSDSISSTATAGSNER